MHTHCEFLEAEFDGGGHVGVGSDSERFKLGQRDELIQNRMVLDSHPGRQRGRENKLMDGLWMSALLTLTAHSRFVFKALLESEQYYSSSASRSIELPRSHPPALSSDQLCASTSPALVRTGSPTCYALGTTSYGTSGRTTSGGDQSASQERPSSLFAELGHRLIQQVLNVPREDLQDNATCGREQMMMALIRADHCGAVCAPRIVASALPTA